MQKSNDVFESVSADSAETRIRHFQASALRRLFYFIALIVYEVPVVECCVTLAVSRLTFLGSTSN
jgi:hypothetical protein